jgi:toxin CcdB
LPFVVDVQSDLLAALDTRFVVPMSRSRLGRAGLPQPLNPVFRVDERDVVLLPQEAGAVLAASLSRPVASLRDDANLIVNAIDAVFSGV